MWRALTEADIVQYISSAEVEALRSVVLAEGQADPVEGAITDVTNMVRGYCANKYDLGDAGTIPEELVQSACHIAIVDIQTRPAGTMIDPESARAKSKSEAMRILRDVSKGTFVLSDEDGEPQSSGGAQKLSSRPPRANRTNLQGL